MSRTQRFRLHPAPVVGAVLLSALLGGLIAVQIRPLDNTRERIDALYGRWLPSTIALRELRAQLAELRAYELAQIAHADKPDRMADYDRRISDKLNALNEQLERYEATEPTGEHARLLGLVKQDLALYLTAHGLIADAVHAGQTEEARRISTDQARPSRRQLFIDLEKLTDLTFDEKPDTEIADR